MFNYTLLDEQRKTFINYYDKSEKDIIIHYLDDNESKIPNTIDNERKILEKMKEQVVKGENFKNVMRNNTISNCTIGASVLVYLFLNTYLKNVGVNEFPGTLTAMMTITASAMSFYGLENSLSGLYDYYKNKLFLDNEEIINEKVTGDNININDVQFMKYNDVKKMVKNVKN